MRLILGRVAVLAVAVAALAAGRAQATTFTVTVGPNGQLSYSPANITVQPGDTVHWVWSTAFPMHSTTSGSPGSPDGNWNSGVHGAPNSFDHTFATAGTFTYYCTVHGAAMTGTITVAAPPPPPPNDTAPTADFGFTPTAPTAGHTVTFTASASDSDGDTISSYRWSFGDGMPDQTTAGATVTHIYAAAGTYSATVVATDVRGTASQPATHAVTISPGSPQISHARITPRPFCARGNPNCAHPGAWLRLHLSQPAMLVVKIVRHVGGRAVVKPIHATGRIGRNRIRITGRGLKPGRYILVVIARNSDGEQSKARIRFRIDSS